MFQTKISEKNQNTRCNFNRNLKNAVYEIIRKNMAEPDGPYITVQCGSENIDQHADTYGTNTGTFNIYYFSSATIFTRPLHNVLYTYTACLVVFVFCVFVIVKSSINIFILYSRFLHFAL